MEKLKKMLKYQNDIAEIQYTINLLEWELRISTPEGAKDDLIELITGYENKLFKLQTSEEYGVLLNDTINSDYFKTLEEPEQRYIKNLLRHYEENKKIPIEFYTKYVELQNKTNVIWEKAKQEDNYNLFKPYLSQIIEMTKQYYRYIDNEKENLYDVMLNKYETGITSSLIEKLFGELKEKILPLIPKEPKQINIPKYEYSENELIDCAKYLLEYIGFDMNKGMLGIYPHGYTEKISKNDIRIAFKKTNNPFDFVSTIIHEGGHAIFEQNIKENLSKFENNSIDNLYALHESQSRLYENILGRNINFWIPIFDEVKKKLKLNITLEEFIKILNNPEPSLIRTEADELTYCMHIILRYEIERDLFNNKITVEDIPEIWNKKMKEYLNVKVDSNSNGLMQDVHWSQGDFGYFPSYLLGTIYDGMFIESINQNLGDIDALLRNGEIKKITNYLIDTIYINGGAYTSLEIIDKICNKEVSVEPIVKYF